MSNSEQTIYLNINSKKVTDENGSGFAQSKPNFFIRDTVLLKAYVHKGTKDEDGSLEMHSMTDAGDWTLVLSDAFGGTKLFQTYTGLHNDPEDWEDVEPEAGKICVFFPVSDSSLLSHVGTEASVTMACTLWHSPTGETADYQCIGNFEANLVNTNSHEYQQMSSESSESSSSSSSTSSSSDSSDSSSSSSDSSDSSLSSESSSSSSGA